MRKMIRNRNGFTLIELMISVVVVGIIAALATPHLEEAWQRQKFRSDNNNLMSKIKTARSYAVSTKTSHGIHLGEDMVFTVFRDDVNPGSGSFDEGDEVMSVDTLAPEFEMLYTDNANGVFMFNSNGSATVSGNGSIYTYAYADNVLSMANITITAATGRARIDASYY